MYVVCTTYIVRFAHFAGGPKIGLQYDDRRPHGGHIPDETRYVRRVTQRSTHPSCGRPFLRASMEGLVRFRAP